MAKPGNKNEQKAPKSKSEKKLSGYTAPAPKPEKKQSGPPMCVCCVCRQTVTKRSTFAHDNGQRQCHKCPPKSAND